VRGRLGIQVRGWFIGQYKEWLRDECSCHRHPLPLSTRKLIRPVTTKVQQRNIAERLFHSFPSRRSV
jgi:hypothetical protein